MGQCTAHSRSGERCKANAVEGYRVCRMHGAGSPHKGRPGGRPPIHGAYSRNVRPDEAETLAGLRQLGISLEDEVALARLQLNRALAWARDESRNTCDGKRCPYTLVDSRLELVSRVAERCKRVADGIQLRIVDEAAIAKVEQVIATHVSDPETLAAIGEELETLDGDLPEWSLELDGD